MKNAATGLKIFFLSLILKKMSLCHCTLLLLDMDTCQNTRGTQSQIGRNLRPRSFQFSNHLSLIIIYFYYLLFIIKSGFKQGEVQRIKMPRKVYKIDDIGNT